MSKEKRLAQRRKVRDKVRALAAEATAARAGLKARRTILTDMERILLLPYKARPREEWEADADRMTQLLRKPRGNIQLWAEQGAVLAEGLRQALEPELGLFVPLGVGYGKTGVGELVGTVMECERPVLLVPPEMQHQCADDRVRMWSRHFDYRPPHTVSHTLLSRPEGTDLLDRMEPDCIIIDEAHAFRHPDSARTGRLIRYMAEHQHCRLVVMSGSFTNKQIKDYLHLLKMALRMGCPVPVDTEIAALWGSCVNAGAMPDAQAFRAMAPLVRWAMAVEPAGMVPSSTMLDTDTDTDVVQARLAFAIRKRSCPGVITSSASAFRGALELRERYVDVPSVVKDALDGVRDLWELPDGTELVGALDFHRACGQLSSGWFSRWVWPERACFPCEGTGMVDGSQCDECEGIQRMTGPDEKWLDKRRTWSSAERSFLKYHARAGLDSPALVQRAVERGYMGDDMTGAWEGWLDIRSRFRRSDGVYAPPSEAVWLDGGDFLANDALHWSQEHPRGILWWRSPELGAKLAERGFQVFGAGSREPGDHVAHPALSINVHGRGKNLQGNATLGVTGWADQYILEPSGGAQEWEQLLGRTHRPGQVHVVRAWVAAHTWFVRAQVTRAIAFARYVEATELQDQKLTMATWPEARKKRRG